MQPQANTRTVTDQEQIQAALRDLLASHGISEYDLVLIGDGSGNAWNKAAGWAVFMGHPARQQFKLLYGGLSEGSINLVEAWAYLHALSWFHGQRDKHEARIQPRVRVKIITDSDLTVQCGNRAVDMSQATPEVNAPTWSAFREFARRGYDIQFFWSRRATHIFNTCADTLASRARESTMSPVYLPRDILQKLSVSVTQSLRALNSGQPPQQIAELAVRNLQFVLPFLLPPEQRTGYQLTTLDLRDPVTGVDLSQLEPYEPDQTDTALRSTEPVTPPRCGTPRARHRDGGGP